MYLIYMFERPSKHGPVPSCYSANACLKFKGIKMTTTNPSKKTLAQNQVSESQQNRVSI